MKNLTKLKTTLITIVLVTLSSIAINAQEVGYAYEVVSPEASIEQGTMFMVKKATRKAITITYMSNNRFLKTKITLEDFYRLTNTPENLDSAMLAGNDLLVESRYKGASLARLTTGLYIGSIVVCSVGIIFMSSGAILIAGFASVAGMVIDRVETQQTADEVEYIGTLVRQMQKNNVQ